MSMKTLARSFAGGEVTPEMWGRIDQLKYQTGLALCRNFIPLPHGPAVNRPGFEYVLEVKDSSKRTRLIPFSYSTQQTFALEFGNQYLRFHTQNATLLEAAKNITGITQANPGVVTSNAHGFSNGQWLFLASIGGMTPLNGRWVKVSAAAANTFALQDLAGNNINTTGYPAYTAGGTAARVYEIATPFLEADLFDIHYVQSADVLTLVHPSYAPRELRRLGATNWTLTTPSFSAATNAPTGVVANTNGPGGGSPYISDYVVTTVNASGLEESIASASATANWDLTVAGNSITVTWSAVTGAVRYNVYKLINGIYGYIGQAGALSFHDQNITPDISQSPPINDVVFNAAGDYPRAVSYYEQRRCFAGTVNQPQNVWMTRSGTESNMSYSIPSRDDDAIRFRIAAREANTIRHLVPLSDLVFLTASAEWPLRTINSDAITPSTISVRPSSYVGASNVQPVVTSSALLYAQDRGGRIREMRYSWEQNGYVSVDISIWAPHLFDDYTIVDMAFARTPTPIHWNVSSSGDLIGMTYIPEQQVAGWHHHDTEDGAALFESVASVVEGIEDALYAIIKRTVNGRTVRYVERMHSRRFTDLEDCFFVDSGLTYSGAPATTITGLYHLEGKQVAILADGAVHPRRTVVNGAITLEQAASTAQIGLPIVADMQTLPAYMQLEAAGQANMKNVNSVTLRAYKSSGVSVGHSFDALTDAKWRTDEPYGTPPQLRSFAPKIVIAGSWGVDGSVCIRKVDPTPITVVSMVLEVAIGG